MAVKRKGEGEEGLKERGGGLNNFLLLKRWGGGGLNRGFTVCRKLI